jgi:CheY-like chemotaxis protein
MIEKNSGTILLVDDEETVRRVAEKILTSSGYEVVSAADGAEAVAVFQGDPARFAAVLLDLTMPHMDGEEAFRVLKGMKPDVRVLIMSGFNEQDTISRFVGRGVAGFLPKPFSAEMLLTRLRDVLAGRHSSDS